MIIKPTPKASAINIMLNAMTGKDREKTIRSYGCTACDQTFKTEEDLLENLRDAISIKEYNITGMCRQCQDSVFNTGE